MSFAFKLLADAIAKSGSDYMANKAQLAQQQPALDKMALEEATASEQLAGAREQLAATREARPFERMKRSFEQQGMIAKLPYLTQLIEADVAAKLAEPVYKRAQAEKAIAEAGKAKGETGLLGLKSAVDPKGNFTVVDIRRGGVTASGKDPWAVEDRPLDQATKRVDYFGKVAGLEESEARKRKLDLETTSYGLPTWLEIEKLGVSKGRLQAFKEALENRKVQQGKADVRALDTVSNRLHNEAEQEVMRSMETLVGPKDIPGATEQDKIKWIGGEIDRVYKHKVEQWNRTNPDRQIRIPVIVPYSVEQKTPEGQTLLQRWFPSWGAAAKPTQKSRRITSDQFRKRFGVSAEDVAAADKSTVDDLLNDPAVIEYVLGEE